ncbi:hypothetical protein ACLKA7_004866 [Drosophila subpalustris]
MRARITEEPAKFPDCTEENGQLYRNLGQRADDEDFIPWKLCVPSGHRRRVLQECHDAPTAGHQGVRKTVARLSQRYYWPGMFRDASRYVKRCEVCQKFKCDQRKPAGQMLIRQVSKPMAALYADFVGPLPRSKHGNTMELVPLKWQHAAPYCPQKNPTERTNRTVKTKIAQFIKGHQSSWDELLPELSLAVNSSLADSTGFNPAFLTLGREPRLPAALYDEVSPGSATSALDPKEKEGRLRKFLISFAMDPEDIMEISIEEEKPWPEVQVEDGRTSGSEPERVEEALSAAADQEWPRVGHPQEGSGGGPWQQVPVQPDPENHGSRSRSTRRKRQHSPEGARRAKESSGSRKRRKGIPAEKEAPPWLVCRLSVDEDPSRPEEPAVARQGEPTPRPPVDQGEPKAPSPTDSELIWDMEDMLEEWDPELDAMFGEMAVHSTTLDPLIPKGCRFKVADEDAEYTITITAAGAVTVTLGKKGGVRRR